jgi:hypothetical protein
MNIPFRMLIAVLALFALGILSGRPALSQFPRPVVGVYPAPSGVTLSQQYFVKIVQYGVELESPVYQTQNPAFAPGCEPNCPTSSSPLEKTTAWTSFSTTGTVTVQVTNKTPFKSVRILPSRSGIVPIVPTVSGDVVSFAMSDAGQLQVSVEFCYSTTSPCDGAHTDITNPLLVFANPPFADPLQGRPRSEVLFAPPGGPVPPLADGQTLLYFGPGLYDLTAVPTTPYVLGSNVTVFLAGGAYVRGMFSIAAKSSGTTIEGPGILSGENVPQSSCLATSTCPKMIEGADITGKVTIAGITIVNAPYYNIALSGQGNTASNIKVISWLANTDGITVAGNDADPAASVVRNSFFKVGDDAIKLYSSNLTVSGCTLWQLDNAAPFEMGVNLWNDVKNVTVENSDVIRTEWTYPNRSNAVVSAAFGNASANQYKFNNIRVENSILAGNSVFQLFKIAVIPNGYTKPGHDTLGTISDLTFSDIQVSDTPTLPNLFQGFDRQSQVKKVMFSNVTVAGQALPQPTPNLNANRNFSIGGTVFTSLLWRSTTLPANFQIGLFSGANGGLPSMIDVTDTPLTAAFNLQLIGDFYGTGSASVLVQHGPATGPSQFYLWQNPMQTDPVYSPVVWPVVPTSEVAGIGDFNGDGCTDILVWNASAQTGTILMMNGPQIIDQLAVKPTTPSSWSVAGVGDIDQNGYSDLIFRDTNGNVEIQTFGVNGFVGSADIAASSFTYSSTANYNTTSPPTSGNFDQTWTVAGVGDFRGIGYASILWTNATTNEVGVTDFAFSSPKVSSGSVFAKLSAGQQIVALGDFNGDDTTDMLLAVGNSNSPLTIWYSEYNGGALYKPGPTFSPSSGYVLQP